MGHDPRKKNGTCRSDWVDPFSPIPYAGQGGSTRTNSQRVRVHISWPVLKTNWVGLWAHCLACMLIWPDPFAALLGSPRIKLKTHNPRQILKYGLTRPIDIRRHYIGGKPTPPAKYGLTRPIDTRRRYIGGKRNSPPFLLFLSNRKIKRYRDQS